MSEQGPGRGIDHLVIAVRDLDRAAEAYAALGFTLTPENLHPFGSKNRIVQLDGLFLEILGIQDGAELAPHDGDAFSFARFNADFLARREGCSMLVMESRDRDADLTAMQAAGLTTCAPFEFSRIANLPDGGTATVGFRLAFATDTSMPESAFFVCEQLAPEHFWKADFQRHANGCAGVVAAHAVCDTPSDTATLFAGLAGSDAVDEIVGGIRIATPRGAIEVLTGDAHKARFGVEPVIDGAHLAGITLSSGEFGAARDHARKAVPAAAISEDRIVIAPDDLFGVMLVIVPA